MKEGIVIVGDLTLLFGIDMKIQNIKPHYNNKTTQSIYLNLG